MTATPSALTAYLQKFTRLRQGVTKYGKAPHKPVLLLAFIQLFEKGELAENKVYISPELVALFKETFALLVRTPHKSDLFLPFYHLSNEGFWSVQTKLGAPLQVYISNFKALNKVVAYGCFPKELFALLMDTLDNPEHTDPTFRKNPEPDSAVAAESNG